MARVFSKPELLRTSTTLDPLESTRLEAMLDALRQEDRHAQTHESEERRRKTGGGYKG